MSLKALAGNLKIGTAIRAKPLQEDPQYGQIIAQEFNLVVPENAMKIGVVCKQSQTYNFDKADQIVQFAQSHGQAIRGHNLCWHMHVPQWIKGLSNLELEQVLRNYIYTTVDRYKGQCYAWDVVNEAINDNGRLRPSLWKSVENYISKCFTWAHEADPEAHLIYLDYRTHAVSRWNAICKMISELKSSGIPVHGVGLQLHHEVFRSLGISTVRLSGLIQQLQSLGVAVHFSEVSIPIYPPTQQLPVATKLALQAKAYNQAMKVCLESHCASFNLWGFTDQYVYYKPPEKDANSIPCLFDRHYQPKPAYHSIAQELARFQGQYCSV
jgi:endo-1,4-beta-xylanase